MGVSISPICQQWLNLFFLHNYYSQIPTVSKLSYTVPTSLISSSCQLKVLVETGYATKGNHRLSLGPPWEILISCRGESCQKDRSTNLQASVGHFEEFTRLTCAKATTPCFYQKFSTCNLILESTVCIFSQRHGVAGNTGNTQENIVEYSASPCKRIMSSWGELATKLSFSPQPVASKNCLFSTNTCRQLKLSPSARILAAVPMHSFVLVRNTLVILFATSSKPSSPSATCLCLHWRLKPACNKSWGHCTVTPWGSREGCQGYEAIDNAANPQFDTAQIVCEEKR